MENRKVIKISMTIKVKVSQNTVERNIKKMKNQNCHKAKR